MVIFEKLGIDRSQALAFNQWNAQRMEDMAKLGKKVLEQQAKDKLNRNIIDVEYEELDATTR